MSPTREELAVIIQDGAESGLERLWDEKNTVKGDDFDSYSWSFLVWMLLGEVVEFLLSLAGVGDSPRHEAGDVSVVMAFMREKAERRKK